MCFISKETWHDKQSGIFPWSFCFNMWRVKHVTGACLYMDLVTCCSQQEETNAMKLCFMLTQLVLKLCIHCVVIPHNRHRTPPVSV